MYGFKHELSLVRDSERAAPVNDVAKINPSKISWFVPHVLPFDEQKLRLYKTIQSKSKIDCGFRMRQCDSIGVPQSSQFHWRLSPKSGLEKPRYIIVAFQTGKSNDQTQNAAVLFDHCPEYIYIRYPQFGSIPSH